ncbi:phosphopantetheine-binding protein [Streptomyces sp. NPDC091272]|uniref:phosphopantetheine-binding protein n=1 Tax=Streptomyces sp. NPDC091272 TaxID=3365981 RepID=UPI00381AA905
MTSLSHHGISPYANGNGAAGPADSGDRAVMSDLVSQITSLQEQHRSTLATLDRLNALVTEVSDRTAHAPARDEAAAASASYGTATAPAPQGAEQPQTGTVPSAPSGEQHMAPPPGVAVAAAHSPAPPVASTPAPPASADTEAAVTTDPTDATDATAAGTTDFLPLLLKVIADVTGYPEDALTEDMSLEEELGIDSIKRVQILAIVRDQVAGLDDADGAEMARLRTIADVAGRLGELTGATGGQNS